MKKSVGGVRGANPVGSSGRWSISDKFFRRDFRPILATGGDTVTDITVGTRLYRVHSFTTTGTSSFVVSDPGTEGTIEYLVLAGGGGGGFNQGGGGGGGGYRSSVQGELSGRGVSAEPSVLVFAGTYTITVGLGGSPGTSSVDATNGGSSSIIGTGVSVAASGGGKGGREISDFRIGGQGGSGGGSMAREISNVGLGTANQGFAGGVGGSTSGGGGGGGGGAGSVGVAGSGQIGGAGGLGITSSITGSALGRGGGGGGGGGTGAGGVGVDGGATATGGNNSSTPSPAPANRGGGGAGNTGGGGGSGSAGGSGIVVIRYPLEVI